MAGKGCKGKPEDRPPAKRPENNIVRHAPMLPAVKSNTGVAARRESLPTKKKGAAVPSKPESK